MFLSCTFVNYYGEKMIRFRLKELMADKSFRESRRITFEELANAIGINRTTLSKIANLKGYNTTIDNLGQLCLYVECTVCDIAESVEDAGE